MGAVTVAENTKKVVVPRASCEHPIIQRQGDTQVCLACKSAVVIDLLVSALPEQPEDVLARAVGEL